MRREADEAGESALEALKQRTFASAFGSFDPKTAIDQYHKLFEEPEIEDFDGEAFEPENEADVQRMLNEARRLGVIR